MKKYTLFFITIYLLLAGLHAQEHYYYYKGEKQFLTLDETRLNITASSSFSKDQIKNAEFEIESGSEFEITR